MRYEQLNDAQLASLRDYVIQDMPAGKREKQLMLLVLEQARRANALMATLTVIRDSECPTEADELAAWDALVAYLGERVSDV